MPRLTSKDGTAPGNHRRPVHLSYCSLFALHRYGISGTTNVQSEAQQKLDILANDLFINMIKSSFTSCLLISEENEKAIEIEVDKQTNIPKYIGMIAIT